MPLDVLLERVKERNASGDPHEKLQRISLYWNSFPQGINWPN